MRRSSSLSLSTWFSFSLDSRCPFFSCLSDFSPVRDSARRPHGRPANGRRASRPSITSRRCRVFAQWPAKPKPLGVMPSPRKWTPQRHGAVARTHLTASGEKGKVGGGVPPQIPAPIATLTSAPVWKRRNHAFRSTWDNATTFREQNIIACRCPDIFTSKRHHLFQTLRGHRDSPSLSRSTSSVVVDHLLSIRACFPGCLGLENAFLDLCCTTGHEETSFVRLRLMRQIGGLK